MVWGNPAAVPALPGPLLLLLAGLLLFAGYWMGRRRRAPRWMALTIGIVVALAPIAIVRATTIFSLPFSFVNGTVADATQVNANFSAVTGEINNLRNQTSVLSECDFRPRTGGTVTCGFNFGGAYISVSAGDPVLVSAVRVPSGATITSVDVKVSDSNNSSNLRVCLFGVFDTGGYDENIPCVSSSGAPGFQNVTIPVTSVAVQGSSETFELFVFSTDNSNNLAIWPSDGSLTVRTAYVHYQTP
jgi:hypothetical protein